ncbi:MAG: hypothetical protein IT361_05585 [Gemmatimonadaceae bacterium]|nr:hypothetical protein [Gemmatimonadaceae bacterium]
MRRPRAPMVNGVSHRRSAATLAMALAAACTAWAPRSAPAQVATLHGASGGPAARDTTTARQHMTSALRALVEAQDAWFGNHERYGRALRRSGTGGVTVQPETGVTLELMYVTGRGWTGRATHRALPGRSCVVFVGQVPDSRMPVTRRDSARPSRERTPVCDA